MQLLYGDVFRCIGGDCEDTCCHGWSVPVDRASHDKLQRLQEQHRRSQISQNLVTNPLCAAETNYAQIRLKPTKDCSFLDEDRLCALQKIYGEEYLPSTCAVYPRVLNRVDGCIEVSLYLSCPEATRVVLLNPNLTLPDDIINPHGHKQELRSSTGDNGQIQLDRPKRYFREIRSLTITMIKDRSRPLWQRLFLVGSLCQKLNRIKTVEQEQAVSAILRDYREIVSTCALRDDLAGVPSQQGAQLHFALLIINQLIRRGSVGTRFLDSFKSFAFGVDYLPGECLPVPSETFLSAEQEYFTPFTVRYPFILENYLVNYVLKNLFPFGREDSNGGYIAIMDQFMLMAAQYTLIRTLLIGIAGHHKLNLTEEHVLRLIQSFCKAVEHNSAFLKELSGFLRDSDLNNSQGFLMLLCTNAPPSASR